VVTAPQLILELSTGSSQRVAKAAGVRPITVHDARHTCATLLADLDVHPRVIMRILRHADQAVTMEIYANASLAATREAQRRLGETPALRSLLYSQL
jgi:integrase